MNEITYMKRQKSQKINVKKVLKSDYKATSMIDSTRVYKDKERYKDQKKFVDKCDAIQPWNGNEIINKLGSENMKKKQIQRLSNTSHLQRLKQKADEKYKMINRSLSQSGDYHLKRREFKMGSPIIRPQTTAIPFRYDNLLQYLRSKSEDRIRRTGSKSENHGNDQENLLNRIFNASFSPKSSKFRKLNFGCAFVIKEDSPSTQPPIKITRIHQKEIKNVYNIHHQNKQANSNKYIEFTTKNIPKSSRMFQKYELQL